MRNEREGENSINPNGFFVLECLNQPPQALWWNHTAVLLISLATALAVNLARTGFSNLRFQ
jgi:hypothetical protein